MTYIISGHDPRTGLRGSLGAIATPTTEDVLKQVGFTGQGDGSEFSPFGGMGGFGDKAEQALTGFVMAGAVFKFKQPSAKAFEQGFFNHEEYVTVTDQKGKFYKFKVKGTGIGREATPAQASSWFSAVNDAARAAKAAATTTFGPLPGRGGSTIDPSSGFRPTTIQREQQSGGGSGDGGGTSTMVYVAGAAVLAAALFLTMKKARG